MKKVYEEENIKSLVNAIKGKAGTTEKVKVSDLPTIVGTIPAPANNLESLEITENGTYNGADYGKDGFKNVEVNVQGGGGGNIQDWLTVDENGDYLAEDYGVDGFKNVSVGVMDFSSEQGYFTPTEEDIVSGGGITIPLSSDVDIRSIVVYRMTPGTETDQYSPNLVSIVFRDTNINSGEITVRHKGSSGTSYTVSQTESTYFKNPARVSTDAFSVGYIVSIYKEDGIQFIKFKTYGQFAFRKNVDYEYFIRHRY